MMCPAHSAENAGFYLSRSVAA